MDSSTCNFLFNNRYMFSENTDNVEVFKATRQELRK